MDIGILGTVREHQLMELLKNIYTATSEVENTHNTRDVDFLSNGFKIRDTKVQVTNSSRQFTL